MYKRKDGLFEKKETINGKRIVFRGHTEKEVYKKFSEYLDDKIRGRKFNDISAVWSGEHFETLEYNSLKVYNVALKRANSRFGDMYVKNIEPNDIKAFMAHLAKEGFAQKTISNQLSILRQIFEYAVIEKELEYSPCQYIKVPKNLPKQVRVGPTEKEKQIILNSTHCTFGIFAYFLLYTGLRKGEALSLLWSDIDFEENLININKSTYFVGNHPHLKATKTSSGTRKVVLMNKLKEKLSPGPPNTYIFGDGETQMPAHRFMINWRAYQAETGLTITPHQLRHAYATILHDAGVDVKDAQDMMGHADISTMKNIYTHISSERKQKTAKLLNEYDG